MSAGNRGTALAKALALWERKQQALDRSVATLESVQVAHQRVAVDVACAMQEIVQAAEMQGRAEAYRTKAPQDAKRHKARLRELAWLQQREAERVREVAMCRGFCNVLLEQVQQATGRVEAALPGAATGEGNGPLHRYLAHKAMVAAKVEAAEAAAADLPL